MFETIKSWFKKKTPADLRPSVVPPPLPPQNRIEYDFEVDRWMVYVDNKLVHRAKTKESADESLKRMTRINAGVLKPSYPPQRPAQAAYTAPTSAATDHPVTTVYQSDNSGFMTGYMMSSILESSREHRERRDAATELLRREPIVQGNTHSTPEPERSAGVVSNWTDNTASTTDMGECHRYDPDPTPTPAYDPTPSTPSYDSSPSYSSGGSSDSWSSSPSYDSSPSYSDSSSYDSSSSFSSSSDSSW